MKELWEQCIEAAGHDFYAHTNDQHSLKSEASRLLDKKNISAKELWKKLSKLPAIKGPVETPQFYRGSRIYACYCEQILNNWEKLPKQSTKEYKSGLLNVAQKARELKSLLIKETQPKLSQKSILDTWHTNGTLPEINIDIDDFWLEPGSTTEYQYLGGKSLLLQGIIGHNEHDDTFLFGEENATPSENNCNDIYSLSDLHDAEMLLLNANHRVRDAYREHIQHEGAIFHEWCEKYQGERDKITIQQITKTAPKKSHFVKIMMIGHLE